MSKINVKQLIESFDDEHDTITFEIDGVYFLATQDEGVMDKIINDGYDKADVIEINKLEKPKPKPSGGDDE